MEEGGEKKKKSKPQNQNTYCPQEKSSRPHKHCLSHYIIHQYLPAEAGDWEKHGPDESSGPAASCALSPGLSVPLPSRPQGHSSQAPPTHNWPVCLPTHTEKASPLSSLHASGPGGWTQAMQWHGLSFVTSEQWWWPSLVLHTSWSERNCDSSFPTSPSWEMSCSSVM